MAHNNQASGFTILELLIASAVFSIILLVVAVGVMRFTEQYYKGITSSKAQAAAREIMAEISQAIEFGTSYGSVGPDPNGVGGICLESTVYGYVLGQQVTDTAPLKQGDPWYQGYHGLVAINGGKCDTGFISGALNTQALSIGSRELLGRHMRLSALQVSQIGNLYTIHVRVIYGDSDLLTPAVSSSTDWSKESCISGTDTQFCAVSDLQTTVERRLL